VQQPPATSAARQITIPPGTSRAKIFALGLTLAGQACGGERTEKADSYGCCIPPYGLGPIGPGRETCADNPLLAGCDGTSGAGGRAGSGGVTSDAGASGAGGSGGTDSAGSGGAAADAGTSDAGASRDAGAEDAGRDTADAGQ